MPRSTLIERTQRVVNLRRAFFRIVEDRLRAVKEAVPDIQVDIGFGPPSDYPKDRDFAYSVWDGKKATIRFSPKVLYVPEATQDALIRHELSHAMLQNASLDHSERDCDAVAERIFGDFIYYDSNDVQTLDAHRPGAIRPRPPHLPK
jgi:hypothetical protein